MTAPFDSVVDGLVEAIAESGYYVGASIFDDAMTKSLRDRARSLCERGSLSDAKVGRSDASAQDRSIRSDRTRWLDDEPSDVTERDAVAAISALRLRLNEALFVNAHQAELHFAHYEPGAFYKTHRDRFADHDARIISLVIYLNDEWSDESGGELVLYDDQSDTSRTAPLRELRRVLPCAGTMVAFRSELFPHEVLPATRDRFSLTGWLRRA